MTFDPAKVACHVGDRFAIGQEPEIAPGIRGIVFDDEDGIYIPLIIATQPKQGDVGRFLDDLPKNRRVVFSTVVSNTLRGMLQRRGFQPTVLRDPTGGYCDAYERLPQEVEDA